MPSIDDEKNWARETQSSIEETTEHFADSEPKQLTLEEIAAAAAKKEIETKLAMEACLAAGRKMQEEKERNRPHDKFWDLRFLNGPNDTDEKPVEKNEEVKKPKSYKYKNSYVDYLERHSPNGRGTILLDLGITEDDIDPDL